MPVTTVGHTLKLTVARNTLLKAIQQASSAINERSTLPILSHLLLHTVKGELICTATDLDMGITVHIPVHTEEDGGLAVPARRFIEMIKESPDGDIELQARKNHSLRIDSEQCSFRLVGLPLEEFPQLPPFPDTNLMCCDQAELKRMLSMTAFAMSHEEARYVLNGCLFSLREGVLSIVATDGHRLALATTTLDNTGTQELTAIVPGKTIRELGKFLHEGRVEMTLLAGNQILFRINHVTLISRLIEGEFPNFERVIPAETTDALTVNRQELLAAVRRANLLATPTAQAVRFEIDTKALTIFKEAADIGEVREEVAITYPAKPLTVYVNPQYLLDALKVLPESGVVWELCSAEKPSVIRSTDYLYMVMPMHPQ